jgi:hypothetical protein
MATLQERRLAYHSQAGDTPKRTRNLQILDPVFKPLRCSGFMRSQTSLREKMISGKSSAMRTRQMKNSSVFMP